MVVRFKTGQRVRYLLEDGEKSVHAEGEVIFARSISSDIKIVRIIFQRKRSHLEVGNFVTNVADRFLSPIDP